MICYYYPPITDVGSKRSVAFSKYLTKYSWNPNVLSVRNPDRTFCRVGNESTPSGVSVAYSRSIINAYGLLGKVNGLLTRLLSLFHIQLKRNYIYDICFFPDHFLGWIPFAIWKGLSIIKKKGIDIIYVSCSPFSSAIIGVVLKMITKKPLIIDFRDPFTFDIPYRKNLPGFRKKLDELYEKMVLKKCDLFLVTTEETRLGYENKYNFIKTKIHTVHNGFDDAILIDKPIVNKYPKFTICYGGNLYFDTGGFPAFFEALKLLSCQNRISNESFQFLFHGHEYQMVEKLSLEYGLQDLVDAKPMISYQENLAVISKSHLHLLRIAKPAISTKLFEGIALNTPFLATIPPGEVENIIRTYSPNSYVITNDSEQDIADAILDAQKKYESGEVVGNRVEDFLGLFSRKNLTLKLIKIMEENIHNHES